MLHVYIRLHWMKNKLKLLLTDKCPAVDKIRFEAITLFKTAL